MGRVRGKVVVVTGASSGIGRDTATRLAAHGATVIAAARDESRLAALAESAPGVSAFRCDVSVDADRAALVAHVLDRHGVIDALVNNAGIGWTGAFAEMPPEEVERLYAVNVVGLVDLTRRVLPAMLERGRGDVVNIASVAGYVALPYYAVYTSTKFAVVGFSDALRRETWGTGVKVHVISPGPVRTEFLPRASGYQPATGAAEARYGGISAVHVARAIERCLTRPLPRVAAVPRAMGLARVALLPGVRQAWDIMSGAATRRYGR